MANVDVTRIAGNIAALNSLYSLQSINSQLAIHQTRLSSGKRLNEAADDPAGMLLATTFDVRRQGLKTVLSAIGDAKNLMSTMEGGLRKIQDILVKMRNKAMEAQGDTIGEGEREAVQIQLRAFRDEINDIVQQTQWNGVALLNGSTGSAASGTTTKNFLTDATGGVSTFYFSGSSGTAGSGTAAGSAGIGKIQAFQSFYSSASVGGTVAGSASGTSGSVGFAGAMAGSAGLGLTDANLTVTDTGGSALTLNGTSMGPLAGAGSAARSNTFAAIEAALNVVKQAISQTGTFTARLSFKEEALMVQHANTEAAYNRIMNANMAEEQVNASKLLILQQTATAMLAQANAAPQFLLSLFK